MYIYIQIPRPDQYFKDALDTFNRRTEIPTSRTNNAMGVDYPALNFFRWVPRRRRTDGPWHTRRSSPVKDACRWYSGYQGAEK